MDFQQSALTVMKFKVFIGGVAVTALICLSVVYGVLYTAPGLSWYLNQATAGLPGTIDIDKVRHSLSGNFKITGFRYSHGDSSVYVKNMEISWNPLSISGNQLAISQMTARNVSIVLGSSDPALLLDKLRQTNLALSAEIKQGQLKNITVQAPTSKLYRIKSLNFNQLYYDNVFYVNKLQLEDYAGDMLEVTGKAGLGPTDIINLTTHTSWRVPWSDTVLKSHGTFVGSTTQLRFLQNVSAPMQITLEGRIKDILSEPFWRFSLSIQKSNSSLLEPRRWINTLQGRLTGQGTSSQLEVNGTLTMQDARGKTWDSSVGLTWGAPNVVFMVSASQPELSPKNNVVINGQWHASQSEFIRSLSMQGKWQNVRWANNNDFFIESSTGQFNFNGARLVSEVTANNVTIGSTGTSVKTLVVSANMEKNNLVKLQGNARTDSGKLAVSAELVNSGAQYHIKSLSFTGNNFVLVRKPEAHIIISPEITLTADNHSMVSSGRIDVPTANIELQGLEPTYRQLTALFAGNQLAAATDKQHFVDKLNLEFGKSVWLHGYGLNAHVTGHLSLVNLSRDSLVADGELNVLKGDYNTPAGRHRVTSGRLKFKNHALDDPELELNVEGIKLTDKSTGTINGLLQTLYKQQQEEKLAMY